MIPSYFKIEILAKRSSRMTLGFNGLNVFNQSINYIRDAMILLILLFCFATKALNENPIKKT